MLRSFSRIARKFREINARYETPRIRMSGAVRTSLLVLRVYLVLLVVLLLYKFATLVGS
jgi:hypothetical protein